jgi:hypothetical protein
MEEKMKNTKDTKTDGREGKKRQKRPLIPRTTPWPKLLAGSAMVAFVGGLLLVRLGNLVGASPTELQTIQVGRSLASLGDNPLLAPYKILVYLLLHLPGSDLLYVRLAAAIITCVSIWLLFTLARRWYGTTTSVWVSIAFASSTWTLQTGRFGAGYSLLIVTILALLNLAAWMSTTTKHSQALIVYSVVSGLALFTPGGLWYVLAITLLAYKALLAHRSKAEPQYVALSAAVMVAFLAGVVSGLVQDTSLVAQWLGLPGQFPTPVVFVKQTIASVVYFIGKGPVLPEIWLAHTPLLDIASTVFLCLGTVFYARHLRNARTRLLLSFVVISMLLIGLNGAVALNYAVPIVYLVLGGGVAYIMHQWNRIFPYNPIPRIMALVLMAGLLMAVIGFHTIRYFVAWRSSPNTVQAYSHNQANPSDTYKTYNHLIQ